MMKAGFRINLVSILIITLFCVLLLPSVLKNIQH